MLFHLLCHFWPMKLCFSSSLIPTRDKYCVVSLRRGSMQWQCECLYPITAWSILWFEVGWSQEFGQSLELAIAFAFPVDLHQLYHFWGKLTPPVAGHFRHPNFKCIRDFKCNFQTTGTHFHDRLMSVYLICKMFVFMPFFLFTLMCTGKRLHIRLKSGTERKRFQLNNARFPGSHTKIVKGLAWKTDKCG